MAKKIKVNPDVCAACCYHMGFGSQPGKEQKDKCQNQNVACNYLGITGKSRIFENGKMAYPPHMCDKFREGINTTDMWTSDNMTLWRNELEKQRLWKELEDASNYR